MSRAVRSNRDDAVKTDEQTDDGEVEADTTEDEEEDEDEDESDDDMPILKYHRLKAQLQAVLQPQGCQLTAICLHPRCLIVGTSQGSVHLLDYDWSGREMGRMVLHRGHCVKCLSIDDSGDYVASCSDDGVVMVFSLQFPPAVTDPQASASVGSNVTGTVTIGQEQAFRFNHPLECVHLDPGYRKKSEKAFVCGGSAGQLFIARKGFFSYREDILHEGEGAITAIAWRGSMVAWANDKGVKILDIEADERISFVERPMIDGRPDDVKCQLLWEGDTSLVIGWYDTVILVQIRPARVVTTGLLARGLPAPPQSRLGEIVCTWRTDCAISGVFPFDIDSMVILGYVNVEDDELHAEKKVYKGDMPRGYRSASRSPLSPEKEMRQRAELQLRNRKDGAMFSFELLPVYGVERVRNATGFLLASSQALSCRKVPDGRPLWRLPRPQLDGILTSPSTKDKAVVGSDSELFRPVMFIAAPEDLVVARVRGLEDRISWMLKKGQKAKAMDVALSNRHKLSSVKVQQLITSHLSDLLDSGEVRTAAAELPRLLGDEPTPWEKWIYTFASRRQLVHLAPYIPRSKPQLSPSTYEMVLTYFLDTDRQVFLDTLRAWGGQDTTGEQRGPLYDVEEMWRHVAEAMVPQRPDVLLLEAHALLHGMAGRFEMALVCFWEMHRLGAGGKGRYEDVFRLIEEHGLFEAAQDRALTLVKMDQDLAGDLLVRYVDRLPVESVVHQLRSDRRLLLWYLHTLFERLPDQYNAPEYRDFHVLQVELYVEAAPPFRPVNWDKGRDDVDGPYHSDLLNFLQWSNHVQLEVALALCQRRSPPLYDEMVYILGRMAHTKEALTILLEKIGSVTRSIEFVERHDKELWADLVQFSLRTPVFLAGLLKHAGDYDVDLARRLLSDIPDDMAIRGLRSKLLDIIASYKFERTQHEGCKRVTSSDMFAKTRALQHAKRRAARVDLPGAMCYGCGGALTRPPKLKPGEDVSQHPRSGAGTKTHVFACRHTYHEVCCVGIERPAAGTKNPFGVTAHVCSVCRKRAEMSLGTGRGDKAMRR